MHALIIEDNLLIATQIEDGLVEIGYASCTIVDGEAAAIEAALARCPDLITADDQLASGTGLAAVQAICADQVIPVVFIVGSSPLSSHSLPYSSTIGKPFGGTRLRQAVAEAISRAYVVRKLAGAGDARASSGDLPKGEVTSADPPKPDL